MQVGGSPIPQFSTQDSTFEVRTVHVGQVVKIAPRAPLDPTWSGLLWTAFVSGEDQVSIRVANTSRAITPAAQEFDFKA